MDVCKVSRECPVTFFKDKEMEERVGITDLINRIVQVLKRDLYWVKISI